MEENKEVGLGDCVIAVTGLNEELQEEDLIDLFTEFGPVKSVHFNIDKKQGYAKGYAFIEYENKADASKAIDKMHKEEIAERQIKVDWAFREDPKKRKHRSRRRSD
mmetsp:Transcript_24227/g.21518  ORF Transcript_24227/g.21518 Transcript_24227/m.21518 type:complete len:106 (+) Transcript_24227:21-338(+)